jgi:hypothetical protein
MAVSCWPVRAHSFNTENKNHISQHKIYKIMSDDVFTLMSLCIILITMQRVREVHTDVVQLSYLRVILVTGLTSLCHMNRKVLRNTLEWWLKNATKSNIWFLSYFHCKQGPQLTCYIKMKCSHFVFIENHNSRSNINVKLCDSEMMTNVEKLHLHFLLEMISATISLNIVPYLWITLYLMYVCNPTMNCIWIKRD